MFRRQSLKTTQHTSNSSRRVTSKETTPSTLRPKFFFSHQQQDHQKIEVTQIHSQDNLVELFTKSLPKTTFQKLVHGIGMCKLYEL
ncbi:hypothetical protein ACFX2G_032802 [Malus domestica]